jgi:anti-sigma regulatory factor (Ser/Thr protein kinase)
MLAESVWPGRSDDELSECARYEALLNVAFRRGRAWRLLCPYDVDALDDEIVELARSTHPLLCLDGSTEASSAYAGADAVRPLEGELREPPVGARALTFTITSLHELREFVTEAAHAARLSSQHTENLRLAVNELASNSVCHGGGAGTLRTWRGNEELVCQVSDHGRIRERMVGRVRPDPDQTSGRGLWLVNHLCDLVQIRSGDHGSVVRVHMRLAGEGAAEHP